MAILDSIFGENWREEKARYREFQKHLKALPIEFQTTYKAIQKYTYSTGLVSSDWMRFVELLEIFDLAVLDGNDVHEIVGNDVAAFCDEFFEAKKGYGDWQEKYRKTLNNYFAENER